MRRLALLAAVLLWAVPAIAAAPAEDLSDLLKRQTQEMLDAVSAGNAAIWDKYLDTDAAITDEAGGVTGKKDTVAQVTPLPKGISGTLAVTDWQLHRHGDVAVATYIADEQEDFHGQRIHSRYRSTTTWMKEPGGWKIVAQQTLALRQDPPAVTLPRAVLQQYAGRYQAAPDLLYEIALKDGELMGGVVGGKAIPLKMELTDVMFTPGQPRSRRIFVRSAGGDVTGFVSRREERDVVWTRVP